MNENKFTPGKIFKGIGIGLLILCAVVLYTIADLRRSTSHASAEAYGLDSLEAEAEPVMEILVWQRNEKIKNPESWTGDYYAVSTENEGKYYNKIPLTLREGESVLTTYDPLAMPTPENDLAVLTVKYDGSFRGTYEIEKPYLVETSPSSANVPGLYGGDVNTDNAAVVTSTDGTFTGEQEISVRIGNYLRNQLNYPGNQPDKVLSDLRDYCTTEKLKDVHPDAPDSLKNLERYVFTTHLTVEALHPVKHDLVMAKAVLEIRWVSRWLTDSLYPALTEAGVTDFPHAEVTVLSYEQSDSFGEE